MSAVVPGVRQTRGFSAAAVKPAVWSETVWDSQTYSDRLGHRVGDNIERHQGSQAASR